MDSLVADVLRRKGRVIHHIDPGATVFEAISKMVELNIGSLLVTDKEGDVAGIMTSRDYLKKVALQGRSSRTTFVAEIMDQDITAVSEGYTITQCLFVMSQKRCHYLPVVDDGVVVGMMSMGDCAREIARDQAVMVQYFVDFIYQRYPA